MKAFVTGGTGFIGKSLVRKLIERDYEVVALSRSERGAAMLRELGAAVTLGDIVQRESMRAGMSGCDLVFHVAGSYDYTAEGIARSESVNVTGTRNVLGLAYELRIPRIIYTSTVAVFGHTHGELVDETHYSGGPFLSEYDRTKWIAHYEVAEQLIQEGAPIIIVMPGGVYGPGDTSALADLMRAFYRGQMPVVPAPEGIVTYAFVDDIAEGHILAAEKGRVGESYVLCGPAVPFGEMVDFWAQLTGKRPPAAAIPARLIRKLAPIAEVAESFMELPQIYSPAILRVAGASYAAVSDKARDELGWKPRPIQSGMLETFEWLAATDPARRDSGENRAAKAILIAASALLLLWLVGRSRQKGKNNPR